MAPASSVDAHSAPLADFFWIAGVDGSEIVDIFLKLGEEYNNTRSQPRPMADTIEEDADAEEEEDALAADSSLPSSKRNSSQRLSFKPADDRRLSFQSLTVDFKESNNASHSNRSSMTIKGSSNGTSFLNDVDFDKALLKFAAERDSFLTDLSLTAGAVVPKPTKPRPKTQKIVAEDISPNPLKSSIGSVRRHMSFRDMSSMKRQPSLARQSSIRTSRRLSNYNSVIPTPQPLEMSPNMHPLKRRFEPVLLDRYPPKGAPDEGHRRGKFPDYVPMFAFPNDIHIVSSDQRPRSTWHGFAMTGGDGSKIHGVCVTIWIPLSHRAADELEKRCEEWRRDNMTEEERELAASLGERLGLERAKLSRLLAQLPTVPSGSAAREELEDEISAVEEKIGLMADLLRPVRHGAASKIDGLTDGDTGFWIPRAYGILGRDPSMTTFWKEWLRSVVIPMMDGAILRVPPTSPRVGRWQPLERYVVNLCMEAFSPLSSKTQVEIAVRELRLFARKEADNELPSSRNTDLYPLFRSLSISNIIILFEYVLAESRIILLSSHIAMLNLVSRAITELLFPFQWTGVFIPVLPARLLQALEAPCPYIVGVERRYENLELPSDDFVLVDLDQDVIESTQRPTPLPRHQRRKLQSLLQLAAPLYRFGVKPGPPAYAIEAYPFDAMPAEIPSIYSSKAASTQLAKYVNLNSGSFGQDPYVTAPPPIFNVFLNARNDVSFPRSQDRPATGSTCKASTPPSPKTSPTSSKFPPLPLTPISRNDSGFALQASLREKRSGHFDAVSRRSSSMAIDRRAGIPRRPSVPFLGHSSNLSVTTLNTDASTSVYAPSVYAQSTIAASTIMPQAFQQPMKNPVGSTLIEGHCLQLQQIDDKSICSICDEKAEDAMYRCSGCKIIVHGRCASQICLVCTVAFHPDQIRAAFVRCFASLLYTYKKFMRPATGDKKKAGMTYSFQMDAFLKSLPHEHAEYMAVLQQTQGFNEFIGERERVDSKSKNPRIVIFDEIILSKRNRGRSSIFSGRMTTDFLSDTSNHLWRSASASSFPPSSRREMAASGDWKSVVTRVPAKLDPNYMKEPRMIQGVPRIPKVTDNSKRKPVPRMANGN
ncbi:hypothetical protein D8B26_003589 [Coccidioides posadasii str. Silveira]|uniref:DDENN domain-containing protein n=3 Tax=Coccidioides posadasii TaxID=199306 RepID=E9D0R5_COCPS|nr:DENN domain containing protein [Coccidioides posadasii C735 delta SOWgp]EER26084.1 DENN domain containing protein [Coccidioides posadasii C735 delta SOWgp]EFW19919.1 dDENN domain-containing protein [Coccidioides posadasii str. Silveira]KMM73512.1 hypothetical protein CPAG_09800 [Coccidioides posadasii RMSCC 3488]QVM08917.1 hypothetical protein D8B26_003589 [Coccidioides posadasii str. Silveira]|eukprot:XP_003068229.1 DENN domain containing protein [Coccidioides posadasii C735 delta SOWgp]